jgi:hypothetical protein
MQAMDDNKLDAILREIASERYVPSETLVRRTKAIIRGKRILQVAVFLSLCMQLLTVGLIVVVLASPEVPPAARVFGGIGLFAYLGCLIVAGVAARERVTWFFQRVEQLIA